MARFLVIEGLIGVGKTSLCRLLGQAWDARLVLEPWDVNPFLADFYTDPERFAFPAQMFYLASRYAQQRDIRQQELFTRAVISDYLFEKDRLFAEQTLRGDELALYYRFARLLADEMPHPDLVIFLDSPTDLILGRNARRAIDAEQKITASYLDKLRDRYDQLFEGYKRAPVIRLNTADINYVDDPNAREAIVRMIGGWLDGRTPSGTPASDHSEREDQPALFELPPG